jgi:methylmalonyl-CoA/ethylmalonyl-CoA epimerase
MKQFTEIACVSIAVPSIDDALPAYTAGLGLEITGERRESKRGFGMEWIELGADGKTFLELIAPTGEGGPVAKFLDQEGTSHVYQVRFAVDDLDEALEELGQRGLSVIKGQDVPGDPRVGWVHPKSTGGVLIELVQFDVAN